MNMNIVLGLSWLRDGADSKMLVTQTEGPEFSLPANELQDQCDMLPPQN